MRSLIRLIRSNRLIRLIRLIKLIRLIRLIGLDLQWRGCLHSYMWGWDWMDGMGWDGKDRMGWSSNIGCSLRAFSVLIRFFFRKVFESFGLS